MMRMGAGVEAWLSFLQKRMWPFWCVPGGSRTPCARSSHPGPLFPLAWGWDVAPINLKGSVCSCSRSSFSSHTAVRAPENPPVPNPSPCVNAFLALAHTASLRLHSIRSLVLQPFCPKWRCTLGDAVLVGRAHGGTSVSRDGRGGATLLPLGPSCVASWKRLVGHGVKHDAGREGRFLVLSSSWAR